jgi:hypothetical protein
MPTPEERARQIDRANLGRQAMAEFQQFVTPGRPQVHRAL